MKKCFILAILMFIITSWANEIKLDDFAYGYTIDFISGNSVYEADIPNNVYKVVTRQDLGDIRVFNSDMEVVPHQLITVNQPQKIEIVAAPIKLTYFPLFIDSRESSLDAKDIIIKTNNEGAIIEIGSNNEINNNLQKNISGYIIDASAIKEQIHSFKVTLKSVNGTHGFRKVNVYASDDLKNWRPVAKEAILASLEHQGKSLKKDTIYLKHAKSDYYRLNWASTDGELMVSSIFAQFTNKVELAGPDLNWKKIAGTLDESQSLSFLYELTGFFPISKVRVNLTQSNSIADVILEAKNNMNQAWQHVKSGTVFSIEQQAVKFEETELSFPTKKAKFWRLTIQSHQSAVGKDIPSLDFGWKTEKIRFLARGNPSFYFGIGNAQFTPMISSIDLADKKFSTTIGQAEFIDYKVLGGEEKLSYEPAKTYPWKSCLLWMVLMLGVGVLGKMAWNLTQTMKNEQAR